jgi:shikimate kinase
VTANGESAGADVAAFPPVVLIGPPGAGKTTVGAALAARLGVTFTDTDAMVEAVAGKPVSDIFITDGELEFRRLERAAVADALGAAGDARVIGLGGGAVMDTETQTRLQGHRVVYLETGFGALVKRVGLDRARPLLIGTSPRAQLKALLDQRLPVYGRLAWRTVKTDNRAPDEIAAEIAAVIEADTAGDGR